MNLIFQHLTKQAKWIYVDLHKALKSERCAFLIAKLKKLTESNSLFAVQNNEGVFPPGLYPCQNFIPLHIRITCKLLINADG